MTDRRTPTLLHAVERLGLYFRPGRNDHTTLLSMLAASPPPFSGAVLDASLARRHDDLRIELMQRSFEAVLDPMAMELATPGGWERPALRRLPWAGDALHSPELLPANNIAALVDPIAEFVAENGYSAVLAPSHFIGGVDDPWFRIDHSAVRRLRSQLDSSGKTDVPIYYRLAIPRKAIVDPAHRRSLAARLRDLEIDAIWLCVHPVNARASANILKSYLELCRDMAEARVPLVAERTGYLGLTLLGFNAVGGIESGITVGEGFDANRLTRPPRRDSDRPPFSPSPRVYIDRLGVFLNVDDAQKFFNARGMRRRFACQDRPCCRTPEDMVRDPRRHLVHSRAQQVAHLMRVPSQSRPPVYLDTIRQASDDAMHAARADSRFGDDQRRLGEWRTTLASIVERNEYARSIPAAPGGRIRRRRSA